MMNLPNLFFTLWLCGSVFLSFSSKAVDCSTTTVGLCDETVDQVIVETITETEINDGRDRILYQYIQYAKRKWPESWQGKINAFNYKYFSSHPEGPLEDKIVQGKIKFNDGKELGFKCNEDPMCNFCDKNLCRTRKFGIGGESVFPILSDLQKVLLDEPYYWVNVDGDRVKLDTIDYLMEQRLFRRTVAKQLNKKPKRVTTKEFETYIDMLLQCNN